MKSMEMEFQGFSGIGSCLRSVKSECTALLNRNRKYEGVSDVGFSSCAAPNYLLSRVRVFQIA